MEEYIPLLHQNLLFSNIKAPDLHTLLKCLSASVRHYAKGDYIFMEGDAATSVGIVLSGNVHILQEDFWGNRTILANIDRGGLFGEAFSCAEVEMLPVSVLAAQASSIMLVNYKKIIATCPTSCSFHAQLIQNMLRILAQKNILLTQKMAYISKRTTREKLLAYLSAQATRAKNNTFHIPFNRQALADYLGVDRSAMSTELGRMRKEGLLQFEKSSFTLLEAFQ